MADIINLRLARKAKARSDAAKTAEANRAKHGQTSGQKAATQAEQARLAKTIDGAKRSPPPPRWPKTPKP
jgi:hypothetical protein